MTYPSAEEREAELAQMTPEEIAEAIDRGEMLRDYFRYGSGDE